jgi:hypothetical protein
MTWAPAFAGATRMGIFIQLGGPEAHENSVESHVIPAKAGIQLSEVDPRLGGGDDGQDFHVYGWTAGPLPLSMTDSDFFTPSEPWGASAALFPLGESDLWTPMGSIGPQKSGRVARCPDALHREAGRAFARRRVMDAQGGQPAPARLPSPRLREARGRVRGSTLPRSFIRTDGPLVRHHSAEGSCQQGEIRLGELVSPLSRRAAIKKPERKGRRSPVPYGTARSPVPDGTAWSPVPDGTGRSFDPSADGR